MLVGDDKLYGSVLGHWLNTCSCSQFTNRSRGNRRVFHAEQRTFCRLVLRTRCSVSSDRELDESLAQMEAQIFHDEGSYIKETPCGNVIRGFESFHDRCVLLLCRHSQQPGGRFRVAGYFARMFRRLGQPQQDGR